VHPYDDILIPTVILTIFMKNLTLLSQLHRLQRIKWEDNCKWLLGWMWREAAMVYFKVHSKNLSRGTEENHSTPQSKQKPSALSLELQISQIRSRNSEHSIMMFGNSDKKVFRF
jgi:hypothetical protein